MMNFAILTVTYAGDMAQFEQLCASIDTHMPAVDHYVLVDRSDLPLFNNKFADERRHVIDLSRALPTLREFNLFGRRMWFHRSFRLARGWIYQQIAKIHFTRGLPHDAVVIVDSDAIFVRPIKADDITQDGKVPLFRAEAPPASVRHSRWQEVARQLLGLPPAPYNGFDYISTAVIWSPAVVRLLVERIEKEKGRNWIASLLKYFRFSEYMLYGLFCDEADGPQRELVSATSRELCHCSWHYELDNPAGIAAFVEDLRPDHAAILIQSNLGIPDVRRRDILGKFDVG